MNYLFDLLVQITKNDWGIIIPASLEIFHVDKVGVVKKRKLLKDTVFTKRESLRVPKERKLLHSNGDHLLSSAIPDLNDEVMEIYDMFKFGSQEDKKISSDDNQKATDVYEMFKFDLQPVIQSKNDKRLFCSSATINNQEVVQMYEMFKFDSFCKVPGCQCNQKFDPFLSLNKLSV